MLKSFYAALIITIIFSGCTTSEIYNVSNPNTHGKYTTQEMQNAIIDAGERLKWDFNIITPDRIIAQYSYNNEKHIAVVDIRYSDSGYSINYLSSVALDYNGETIHKAYNKLVVDLEEEINKKISRGEKIFVTLEPPSTEITVYGSSSKIESKK